MTTAPETPTTQELHTRYPLSAEGELAVIGMRATVSHAIESYETHTLGIVGYCARPNKDDAATIMHESGLVADLHNPDTGLVTLHRGPMWKPRSKPTAWHGEETTDPEGVYQTMRDEAELHANLAVEIGQGYHLSRYGHLLTFIWTGARKVDDDDLMKRVALEDPTIPLGIKNDQDGTIDSALEQVNLATERRGAEGAPVILIYRGGIAAQNPEAWEEVITEVHEKTEGRYLLDTAHDTERAHAPARDFEKSVDGQVLAMYAMNRLARDRLGKSGHIVAGSMMEAGELESPVDPLMPLSLALGGLKDLHTIKQNHSHIQSQLAVPNYP